jgi:hypothetical protein
MLKNILVVLTSLFILAGCGNAAKEPAEKITQLLNQQAWETLWNMTAKESQSKTEQQLNRMRSSPAKRVMLADFLQISESEIDQLTPQSYFVSIMKIAAKNDPSPTQLISVDTNGDVAIVTTKKSGVKTESEMIKVGNDWKVKMKFKGE